MYFQQTQWELTDEGPQKDHSHRLKVNLIGLNTSFPGVQLKSNGILWTACDGQGNFGFGFLRNSSTVFSNESNKLSASSAVTYLVQYPARKPKLPFNWWVTFKQ